MKHLLAGVFALLLVTGMAVANDIDVEAMVPVQEHVLDNGMRLLMIEDHSAPIISYWVYYNVGSRHERPGSAAMSRSVRLWSMPTERCSQLPVTGAKPTTIQLRMRKCWLCAKPPINSVTGDYRVALWS